MSQTLKKAVFPVKICGLTRWEDIELASRLGAWALGFVIYPKSPRYLSADQLGPFINRLHQEFQNPPKTVAVVVNETLANLKRMIDVSGVDAVQLHGDESVEEVQKICQNLDAEIIKAFRPRSPADLGDAKHLTEVDYFLVDAAVQGVYGGSGQLADWSLANSLKQHRPVLLSGGLKPENVVQAIKAVNPAALDLSSGVEERPGLKSKAKLMDLFRQLEEAL